MAKAKKGDKLRCEVCGLVVVVDEFGRTGVGEIICCQGKPMGKVKAVAKKAAAPKAAKPAAKKAAAPKAVKPVAKKAAKPAAKPVAKKPAAKKPAAAPKAPAKKPAAKVKK
jgi:hypothetical protein